MSIPLHLEANLLQLQEKLPLPLPLGSMPAVSVSMSLKGAESAEILLSCGAAVDANCPDESGMTPLQWSAQDTSHHFAAPRVLSLSG